MTRRWPNREGWELLDVVPDGLVVVDRDGMIVHVNREAERMLGYAKDELCGASLEVLVPPSARVVHAGHVRGFQGSRVSRPMGCGRELTVLRKDGSELAVEIGLSPVELDGDTVVVASLRDVRERREAVNALRRREEELAITLASIDDGVIATDVDGRVVRMNPRAEELTGWSAGEALGRSVHEIFAARGRGDNLASHPVPRSRGDTTRRTVVEVDRVMRTGASGEVELTLERADGARRCVARLGPLGPKGAVRGAVIVVTDVTDRKRAEAQLATSERMAAIGMLAAGVAHEINNPLSALVANVDLSLRRVRQLAKKDPTLDDLEDALRDAHDASERVRHLVRDLKVFSRGDDTENSVVDVPKILDSTLRLAWNEIRHRARLVRSFGPMPLVYASEPRLGQVFLNLLVNAAQAIPVGHADGNEIRVVTRTDELGRAVVEIADTGVGMAPDVRGRLFTPFFTTKQRGAGTGLGLAICHRIVTNLGGDIAVDSTPGHGTTFRVSLPAADEHARAHAPTPAPHVSPAPPVVSGVSRRGLVLVVDDDDLVLHTVRRVLGVEHDVAITSHGAEALRWVREGRRYDVILCDLMMPSMTGMDVYDAVAAVAPELRERFVFATGGAFTARAAKFFETVSNPTLHKPFELDDLRRLVNELVVSRPAP